jgi:hypothetical protein
MSRDAQLVSLGLRVQEKGHFRRAIFMMNPKPIDRLQWVMAH